MKVWLTNSGNKVKEHVNLDHASRVFFQDNKLSIMFNCGLNVQYSETLEQYKLMAEPQPITPQPTTTVRP